MSVSATKLVREIREALGVEGVNWPVESLAADYAQLCQAACQRLDSCAVMLGKGSDYQALQLAEAEPGLLDLLATLSFAEVPGWVAFCEGRQLPLPPKFDPKAVQSLDQLYAKGITANHPLYKDYRGAVTSRDDGQAIQIIRSIVRLNPEDTNAKAELARLENKLFQLKLQELRPALEAGEEGAIVAAVSELEGLASAERLAEVPEYAAGREVRRLGARREAMSVADRLVESLEEEQRAGAWRMVADLLSRLRVLQAEHGFELTPPAVAKCRQLEQILENHRSEAAETGRFQAAMAALDRLAGEFDSRILTRSSLTLNDAESLLANFSRCWKEVEKFQRPVSEGFVARVRASAAGLQAELERIQRQRRVKLIATVVVVALGLLVAGWWVIGSMRASDYAGQLAKLQSGGQVEPAEKMILEVRKEHGSLAKKPKLSGRLNEVERWTRDERGKLTEAEGRLSELEAIASQGMGNADPMDLATKMSSASQLTSGVALGIRAAPAGRLLILQNQFEANLVGIREKLVAKAELELTELERLVETKLSYDQTRSGISESLGVIDPRLKLLETQVSPVVVALALPSAQAARISEVRKRVDTFHEEMVGLGKVGEAVLQATTLESYVEALAGYKNSQLAQTPEVSEARKVLAALPKGDELLAGLLMPGDPVGWSAAKKDTSGGPQIPDSALPLEVSKLSALRGDVFLNEISEVTLTDLRQKGVKRDLYLRGTLTKDGPRGIGDETLTTKWKGAICDPMLKTERPAFISREISWVHAKTGDSGDGELGEPRLTAISECLQRMELNRMTDEEGLKFMRPFLRLFDELVLEKSSNPLAKAYVMQQLANIINIRPYAWGLEYCPSLRKDLVEMDRLCGGDGLLGSDWLSSRKRGALDGVLTPFFAELQTRKYVAEAQIVREVVQAVLKAGLQFGGFIDSSGKSHLLGEARHAKTLWALNLEGTKLTRFHEATDQKVRPSVALFSPIFFVPLDREELLRQIKGRMTDPKAKEMKLPAIPWLETL